MNNYRTMQMVSERKDEEMTPEFILEIHREVTAGTLDHSEDEGRFRRTVDDVRVEDDETGEMPHVPPPAGLLEERMRKFCEIANGREMHGFFHPVIRSMLLHFWIGYDHPFVDGNGRTARALFYWSILRHGYWLAEYFSISQEILRAPKQYYRAFLHTETDGNDLNYFLLHHFELLRQSIRSLHDSIRHKQSEVSAFRRKFGGVSPFNARQIALLGHALENPSATYTVASHQNSHRISNQTAKNDLVELVTGGLLLQGKAGKAFTYHPAKELREKIGI